MKVLPFTPNYLRKDNAYAKNKNGAEEEPEQKKKTVIPNAIKTVDEVDGKIAEVVKKRSRPFGSKNKKRDIETHEH